VTAAPIPYLRGCYGALSVFQHGSPTCGRCANFVACGEAVRETLTLVGAQVDASDFALEYRNGAIKAGEMPEPPPAEQQSPLVERKTPARKVKYVLSEEQQVICEGLPKKAARVLDTLIRNGKLEAMQEAPKKGMNPFRDAAPNWLEVAYDALLAGGFSKKELKELLMTKLQWGETTAFPHVTKTVAILTSIGVIEERGGRFVLTEHNEE